MAQQILARRDGDTFQARQFWRKAAILLDPEGPIARVGFESGPKGFDDIWVEYQAGRGLLDQTGNLILREHIQCKWHVSPNTYGHAELVDPEFINANAVSILQRLKNAQAQYAVAATRHRFRFLTNWRVATDDPLQAIIHQRSHSLRLERLFDGSTDRSAMGKVRRMWRDHLSLDEDELRSMLHSLAISGATDSLDQMRHDLDPLFRIAGLRRIPESDSSFIYDQVVYDWMSQGRIEFDKDSLRSACEREHLLAEQQERRPLVFGVKSFEHATDRLEDRCTAVLNLIPYFNDRQIRAPSDWRDAIYPNLKQFLLDAAKTGDRLRLIMDMHLTLSFAAGSILNTKSGRVVEIEQRTLASGKSIWSLDDREPDPAWPIWKFDTALSGSQSGELVVAVSLTHDTSRRVLDFAGARLHAVGNVLNASLNVPASNLAVVCGAHAFGLAERLVAEVKRIREHHTLHGRIHLFIAGPGAFSFYLGQHQTALGPVTLYEFDFEGSSGGSYEPALSLPISPASN